MGADHKRRTDPEGSGRRVRGTGDSRHQDAAPTEHHRAAAQPGSADTTQVESRQDANPCDSQSGWREQTRTNSNSRNTAGPSFRLGSRSLTRRRPITSRGSADPPDRKPTDHGRTRHRIRPTRRTASQPTMGVLDIEYSSGNGALEELLLSIDRPGDFCAHGQVVRAHAAVGGGGDRFALLSGARHAGPRPDRGRDARGDERQRYAQHHPGDVRRRSAEGHPDAELASAPGHGVRRQPEQPDGQLHRRGPVAV